MKNIEKEVNKALIINWIDKNFEKGSVKFEIIDENKFKLIDLKGDTIVLDINKLEY